MNIDLRQGNCLELMKEIPSGSIDLILTDPPYGTVKDIGVSDTIKHGMKDKTGWDKALDIQEMFINCERVLRKNGTLVLFSQEPYTSKLITEVHNNLPFNYRMVWLKDHFANALIAKVAPVSYFEDIPVFTKKYDTLALNPLRNYSKLIINYLGFGLNKINEHLGHRKAEHFFYVNSTQYDLCTEEVYNQIIEKFNIGEMDEFKTFEWLKKENEKYKMEQNKVFNLEEGKRIKSNVLEYKKDYEGLHPTQKPVALLEDLIKTYSNEGDKVLDFTMGSGSTGVACVNLNRRFIGMELDEKYFEIARARINNVRKQSKLECEKE